MTGGNRLSAGRQLVVNHHSFTPGLPPSLSPYPYPYKQGPNDGEIETIIQNITFSLNVIIMKYNYPRESVNIQKFFCKSYAPGPNNFFLIPR